MDITKHHLIYPAAKLSDAEKQELLQKYNVTLKDLPKILKEDPTLTKLSIKIGDVIKIERPSKTAGLSHYYRVVING